MNPGCSKQDKNTLLIPLLSCIHTAHTTCSALWVSHPHAPGHIWQRSALYWVTFPSLELGWCKVTVLIGFGALKTLNGFLLVSLNDIHNSKTLRCVMYRFSDSHFLLTRYFKSFSYLFLQLTLTLLQFRDVSRALGQHGLLLLEWKLQLQVLLAGALTHQAGTVELLLQGGHLEREEQGRG